MEHEKDQEKKVYNPEHKTHEQTEHHAGQEHKVEQHINEKKPKSSVSKANWILLTIFALLILLNQYQVYSLNQITGHTTLSYGGDDLSGVDITKIQSTAQGIAVLFPVDKIKTEEDAIAIMIPTGTPDYGTAMGVTYDDPVAGENALAAAYPALKAQAQANPAIWQRYIALAAAPRGISCEFCCGVGPQGITSDGSLRCGCAHNPAVQAVTLWLMMNTDYTDAQILREVYRWKSLWFPKNMVGLAYQIAGGDTSVLQNLPGQVGGC